MARQRANIGLTAIGAVAVVGALVAGIFHYPQQVIAAPEPSTQPPPSVNTVTIKPIKLRIWSQFSGRLTAVNRVDVRPRVSGMIEKVWFEDGQQVKAGDPLYLIDPRVYKARVASAKAELASAQARTHLAKLELQRTKGLIKKKMVSQSAFDASDNEYRVAITGIQAAQAGLQQAELNLEYAHITAPVSGRISRAEITIGNLVEAGANAPILTTIVSNDRLFAEFEVDEQTYINAIRQGGVGAELPVDLTLTSDARIYQGEIHDFDNRIDTASGTIRARAVFENSDGALVPGMYVDVRLGSATEQEMILISERAISTDQDRKYVYVINDEGKVAYRQVTLGRSVNGKRVIRSGLNSGEQVITSGLHRVRPDMKVTAI